MDKPCPHHVPRIWHIARSSSYAYGTRTSCWNGCQGQLAAKAAWTTAAAPEHPEDREEDNEDSSHNEGDWPTWNIRSFSHYLTHTAIALARHFNDQNRAVGCDQTWKGNGRWRRADERVILQSFYEETEFCVLYQLAVLRQVTMRGEAACQPSMQVWFGCMKSFPIGNGCFIHHWLILQISHLRNHQINSICAILMVTSTSS